MCHDIGTAGNELGSHDDDAAYLVMIGAALRSHDDALDVARDSPPVLLTVGVNPVLIDVLMAGTCSRRR